MASATVDSSSDGLHLEAIPSIDLGLLSQSELYALSLCSEGAFDPRRCDDVVIPKIDRSVFNESAGSRKQTYSRLRLAPRKPEISANIPHRSPPPKPASDAGDLNDSDRVENSQIIGLLKELFAAETNGGELVRVRVVSSESMPKPSNAVVAAGVKRKRGRPRKTVSVAEAEVKVPVVHEGGDVIRKDVVLSESTVDKDRGIVNKNAGIVNVAGLADLEDPYGPEMKRRSEGLNTEEGLLGFLRGLNGHWGSRRKKKKIIDASEFGNILPDGWKLMLMIKRKESRAWLFCRRYISPSGRQFSSCKDVSSYLLSLSSLQDAYSTRCAQSQECQLTNKMVSAHASDLAVEDSKNGDISCHLPSPVPYLSNDQDKQVTSDIQMEVEVEILKCTKCNITFNVKDDLLQHQLSCQRRKRSKSGTSITDGVIIKGGKYECQFCHKTFHERHRYNGHVGAHVRYDVKSVETSSNVPSVQNVAEPFAGVPPRDSITPTSTKNVNITVAEPLIVEVDGVSSSGCHNKNEADSNTETYANKFGNDLNVLSHDKQDRHAIERKETLPEESCNVQDKYHKMGDDNLEDVDGKTAVDTVKLIGPASKDALSNKDNINHCEPCGETGVLANGSCVGQQRCLQNCSPALFVKNQTCTETKSNKDSASIKEPIQEDGLAIPSGSMKLLDIEMMEEGRLGNTMEEFEINRETLASNGPLSGFCGSCTGKDGNCVTEVKKQNSSDVYSLVPLESEQICNGGDNVNVLTSSVSESSQKMGSESSKPTVSGDEEQCLVEGNSLIVGFCSSSAERNQNSITSIEQERSFESHSLPPMKDPSIFEYSGNGASDCVIEEFGQEKCSGNSLLSLSGYEQLHDIENTEGMVSAREIEESKLDELQTTSDAVFSFGQNYDGPSADVTTSDKHDGILQLFSLLPSGNQLISSGQDNAIQAYDSLAEMPKQGRCAESGTHTFNSIGQPCHDAFAMYKVSTSSFQESKLDEVSNDGNTELILAYGNVHTKPNADDVSGVSNEQIWGFEPNRSRVDYNTQVEPQLERGSGTGSLGTSYNGHEYNLNRVYNGGLWDGPGIDEIGYPRNEKLMGGFRTSNLQPDLGIMPGGYWRADEENILQSSVPNNSASQAQTSSCFRSFDVNSDKGENGINRVNRKYDTTSCFEGLRSDGIGLVEFNFLPTQNLNSFPQDPNVFSYETEMNRGYDSSLWHGREVMTSNLTVRNQVITSCVWCRNEFHQEQPTHSGTQIGSIGSMCPACSAKLSQQFNV